MLEMAWHAGQEGIHKHRLCRRLGVSMKKMKNRMDDVKRRFGIMETDEQDGKQVCSQAACTCLPPYIITANTNNSAVNAVNHSTQGT